MVTFIKKIKPMKVYEKVSSVSELMYYSTVDNFLSDEMHSIWGGGCI